MIHQDWLDKKTFIALSGWSARHVERKDAAGELVTRETAERSPNGKPVKQYAAQSLPADAQMNRLRQRMQSQALVPVKHSPTAIATLPAPDSDRTIRALDTLSGEEKQQAESRLQIIAPLIDFQNKTNGHKPVFRTADGKEIDTLAGIAKHVAAISGFSERQIWRLWKRYKGGGPGALADRRRSDLNTSRFFADHLEAGQFAQNKFLNERLSVRLVHDALLREWPRLRTGEADRAPGYTTLRCYLKGLSPLITAVAREGERRYNEDFAPFNIRKIEAKRPNEYWISDHMIHDVWVRNWDEETNGPAFGELRPNEAFRPILTCVQDMRSRRIVGTCWCVNPSSDTISSALRFALRSYGIPGTLYIDNGNDYKRIAGNGYQIPGVSKDCQGVLTKLGIAAQHCIPYHPQSKQIESFFRTFHQRFDVLWKAQGVYCGISPSARPEECDASLLEHKRLVKAGQPENSPLPLARQFIQLALHWIDEFNFTFRHSGQGMRGRSPRDVYDAELPPASRVPVDTERVAHLFWKRELRTVEEGGCVRLFNARYEPADADSRTSLMLYMGKPSPSEEKRKALIACDPLNVGEAIALTLEEKFLGTLRAQELLVHGETSRAQIAQGMRLRQGVFRAAKQYAEAIGRQRALAGDVTEIESLGLRHGKKETVNIHRALPVLKAVNDAVPSRKSLHAGNIADSFFEEE